MPNHLYRYRSARRLLGESHELDAQQIYFSPPHELNDPVEGFKDVYWLGDAVVWRNLLKHYMLCLVNVAQFSFAGDADGGKAYLSNTVLVTPDDLPVAPVRQIYERTKEAFLAEPAVGRFVELMAARTAPVRRNELTNYLRSLHPFALSALLNEFASQGILPQPSAFNLADLRINAIKMMESASLLPKVEHAPERAAETFFTLNELLVRQISLIGEYRMSDKASARSLAFLCNYFPTTYADALDRLVHRDLYIACFSANPINASMWGTYGDGHHGVCLKFKTSPNSDGTPSLNLNRVVGVGGPLESPVYSWSFLLHPFRKVVYEPAFPAIDFFHSLGNISHIKLNRFWYMDDGGKRSVCGEGAFIDQGARDAYWKDFEAGALCKTSDWAHEDEYRLLLHSGFDLNERPMRQLQYKFEDLAGVIFGARTDLQDKLKIVEIIDRKCAAERRSDFEFLEVRHAAESGGFQLIRMDLLKLRYD